MIPRPVIFDVGRTLVDGQAHIMAVMAGAFATIDCPRGDAGLPGVLEHLRG
ncbi:MAG: hypothetical protein GDA52_08340 [Rhodobacteraceae bacterium]|nr:hypothetical protein [Paracoccaceae bacterium]